MDISNANAELQMPQSLLPSPEPAKENEALTREGVPEAKEAGKHEQKNYESGHSEISRKAAQAVSVTLTKPAEKAQPQKTEAEPEQTPVQSEQELQLFNAKGKIAGNQEPKVVDVVL